MSIKTKLVLGSLFGMFLFAPFSASAGLIISEIMYDSEGSDIDWVEVYNDGDGEVDITSYKLLISNSTSNHSIKEYSSSSILSGGEYGVVVVNSQISAYLDAFGSVGKIFTASFSLPNVTEEQTATVEINTGDKLAPVDSVTYEMILGAKGDGNSLQLIEGDWKASPPTPSAKNEFVEGSGDSEDEESSSDDDSDDEVVSKKKPKIEAKIFAKNTVFAGEPTDFLATITENRKAVDYKGKYHLNTGDGASYLQYKYPSKIEHIYHYPGEYAVLFDYFPDVFTEDPEYKDRMSVSVIPVEVSIEKVGLDDAVIFDKLSLLMKDFGIKIKNDSKEEIDIGGWSLENDGKAFIFPLNTILLAENTLIVSSKLTGLPFINKRDVKLFSSTGDLIASYE